MPVSEEKYLKFALDNYKVPWELHCGVLREKPPLSWDHGDIIMELVFMIGNQLDRDVFTVRSNSGRVRRSAESYYIPDLMIVPMSLVRPHLGDYSLEYYAEPLPLVV